MKPEQLVRPEILALTAYRLPDASGMVKLDAMENPYTLPEVLRRQLAERLARVELNRYPDSEGRALCELIARKMRVPAGMEVMIGNGSDELLQVVTLALARPGTTMMYPRPTFVMYSMYSAVTGMKAVPMPLREDFTLDAAAFIARMKTEDPALVFLSYPNNPTGTLYPEADVVAVIKACNGVVVVDEAYQPFAGKSFMGRLAEFPNVVLMRTLSKMGLAGIRLGYLVARPEWTAQFHKVRSPYNVNVLTQTAGLFVLEHLEVLEEQAERIKAERALLAKALASLPGVKVFPSEANFLLVRVPDSDRADERLRRQGVLVKNLNGPTIQNCLRITIGTEEENRILLKALKEAL
jgi:histidinol-phosphate aminotransferase